MGRQKKIKAVDPFASTTRKASLNQDSGKWNNPPKANEQKASRMHLLMVKSMENMKKPRKRKQGEVKNNKDDIDSQNNLKKRPGENNQRYLRRLNNEAQTLLAAARMQDRIRGHMEFNPPKKGMSERKRERLNKKRERLQKKKKEHEIRQKEKELFTDRVEFGDVTTRPPEFLAKPRNSQHTDAKPGMRNLLLKNMLTKQIDSSSDSQKPSPHIPKPSRSNRTIKQTKKRKHMTESEKRQFDKAQAEAITAYRKAKLTQIKDSKEKAKRQPKDMEVF